MRRFKTGRSHDTVGIPYIIHQSEGRIAKRCGLRPTQGATFTRPHTRSAPGNHPWPLVTIALGLFGLFVLVATHLDVCSHWLARLWEGPGAAPPLVVPHLVCPVDKDGDGLTDLEDIAAGARQEVTERTIYVDDYYSGGYPPDGLGVCTDVIWRAFEAAGYDLKSLVDADIRAHPSDYPRVIWGPDPNIDFRRVPNLVVFLEKVATSLTTEVRPGDPVNLAQWQGGDVVVFGTGGVYDHIAIISDRRRSDGVPLIIHNQGPWATEEDALLTRPTGIAAHFRFPVWEESPGGG